MMQFFQYINNASAFATYWFITVMMTRVEHSPAGAYDLQNALVNMIN